MCETYQKVNKLIQAKTETVGKLDRYVGGQSQTVFVTVSCKKFVWDDDWRLRF